LVSIVKEDFDFEKMSYLQGLSFKNTINGSKISKDLPNDLIEYLINEEKIKVTKSIMENMQFVIVHNNMDVGASDIKRRFFFLKYK
jgi:hypothetical protein